MLFQMVGGLHRDTFVKEALFIRILADHGRIIKGQQELAPDLAIT